LFLFVGGSTATRADYEKEQKKRDLRIFKRMLPLLLLLCRRFRFFLRLFGKKHKAAAGLQNQSMTRENGGLTPWES